MYFNNHLFGNSMRFAVERLFFKGSTFCVEVSGRNWAKEGCWEKDWRAGGEEGRKGREGGGGAVWLQL